MATQNVRICSKGDIPNGQGKGFKVGKLELAVFHTESGFFATCNVCSHEYEHLHEGWLEDHLIECPKHGSQFDLRTGDAISLPATQPIEVYEVKLEGDDVIVAIPEKYLNAVGVGKES